MAASEVGQLVDSEIGGYPNSSDDVPLFDSIPATTEFESSGVPLNTPWTFWLDKSIPGSTAAQVEQNLYRIYKVSTVESFWAVYNNIPDVDKLKNRFSYHLMRNDIKPMWEDPWNATGGDWKFKIEKDQTSRAWKELLLATIGERFSDCILPEDEICGISVSIRNTEDVLQVWKKKADLEHDKPSRLAEMVKDVLKGIKIKTSFYKSHGEHHAFEGGSNK